MITLTVKSLAARVALVGACILSLAGCAGNIELGPDAVPAAPAGASVGE